VPRYFFSFDDGEPGTPDLVGLDLPNAEAAKAEAFKLAAELGLDRAIEGQAPPFKWIEVTDEVQGRLSASPSSTARVSRTDPPRVRECPRPPFRPLGSATRWVRS
jgi:hypothetical protein